MRQGVNQMKSISWVVCGVAILAGCSVNTTGPTTAWGKKGVSMLDYRTDASQCTLVGVTHSTDANGAKTAGGLSGQNPSAPVQQASGSATSGSAGAGGSGGGLNSLGGGGVYRDNTPADVVNRAAMQQRTQEMAEQQARKEALSSCLVSRGYTEFQLTAEQRAQLAKLPQGSAERREYLYKLGTDEEILARQSLKKQ